MRDPCVPRHWGRPDFYFMNLCEIPQVLLRRKGEDVADLRELLESVAQSRGAAIMGVVNVTPDSFYDGGRYLDVSRAAERVDRLIEDGADVLDIGGESSRPGSTPVPAAEQIARIGPALRHAVARGAVVSVDTTSPEVADHALSLGARIVNDVSCLADDDLARVTARHGAALVITHARGPMQKMAGFSQWPDGGYGDVVADVLAEWSAARERACAAGVRREDVILDPGLGFSKNARHSLKLLRRLGELGRAGALVAVGPGRKSFIASVDPSPPEERLGGTIAACVLAVQHGAKLVRVHDVRPVRQALALTHALGGAVDAA